MPRQSVYQTVSRPTTSIEQLKQHGQSIWLDFIGRGVVRQGEFERLIADDGPTGVTGIGKPSIGPSPKAAITMMHLKDWLSSIPTSTRERSTNALQL